MEHHDVGLPPLDRSMRRQRVDNASVGRLLCPLSASKFNGHNGGLQAACVSAGHLVQSTQSERQYMVHLHNNADKGNGPEMAHQTDSFQNSMFKKKIPAGKESMVQLLNGNSNVPSDGGFLSSDTLRNIPAIPGAGFGDVNSFTTNQYGFSGMGGMRGPMQDLLNSFTTRVPNAFYMDINGFSQIPQKNNNAGQSICEHSIEETCSQIGAEAHASVVDESGYESSDSSLYDVYSDDDSYGNKCAGPGEDKSMSEEENLVDCNHDSEHVGCANGQIEVGDGDNPCNEEVPDCQCITGNPYMHVMTELAEGDDETTTWQKRTRSTSGEKRPDFRVTKGMGPIEIALRNAPTRKTKYIFEPVLGITFDSEPEAFDFYNMYSWEVGFGIKRENLRRSTTDGSMTRRDLRCLCHGVPKEGQNRSKKTGCKAMLRLLRSKDNGWYISQHISEHNHPLTETCGQTNEWRSHERLDANAIDMIKYLRENNVSLTKVHCFMGSVFGSMDKIPFSKRALRAICRRIAKDQMDDDVQKVLNTFREMRKLDEGFQCSFLPDENNRIKSLMWINGNSKQQYQCFGDVITFDTTYCTNIYKMPFGLFVGVNNHFQTIIFGGVFMKDETIPSFEWVFEEFVSLMGGKLPQTVFTGELYLH